MLSFHIEGHSSQRVMLVMVCSPPRKEIQEKQKEKEKKKEKRLFVLIVQWIGYGSLFVHWIGYGKIVCSIGWLWKHCLFNGLAMRRYLSTR